MKELIHLIQACFSTINQEQEHLERILLKRFFDCCCESVRDISAKFKIIMFGRKKICIQFVILIFMISLLILHLNQSIKSKCLTLFDMGSKIYVKLPWGFFSHPHVVLGNGIFCSKNDITILLHIFEDLKEGLEPIRSPQPPKRPTF